MIYLHVDVDNLWMYEREFGVKILNDKEYIYTKALPNLLKLLKKTKSKATFFIIGLDLNLAECRSFCKKAISDGHEIANHTWSHPIDFGKLSLGEKRIEILKAHNKILKTCKVAPVGFRSPGYFLDKDIESILQELNYVYDSSVLPGFAQIFMTAYVYLKGRKNRRKAFGRMNYIFSKNIPYKLLEQGERKLFELPISVFRIVRFPIHTTFAFYFGFLYKKLIIKYTQTKHDYLLYLFHAIDFIDLGKKRPNHPVIPLRYSFEERMNYLEKILENLIHANGAPLKTTRDTIANHH